MSTPGFTAEASLCKSISSYLTHGTASGSSSTLVNLAQIDWRLRPLPGIREPLCVWSVDRECVRRCELDCAIRCTAECFREGVGVDQTCRSLCLDRCYRSCEGSCTVCLP